MNRKLRILMVSLRFAPIKAGGSERQVQRLCRALVDKGIEVTVVTGRAGRCDVAKEEEIDGYKVFRIAEPALILNGKRRLGSYSFMFSLARFLWKFRNDYDLIHEHLGGEIAAICQCFVSIVKKPFITKISNSGPDFAPVSLRKKPIVGKLFFRSFLKSDKVVVINTENQKRCLEIGIKPKQLVKIPNGVPLFELPKPEKRSELRRKLMNSSEILFVLVSNLVPNKRIDLFIEALADLSGTIPSFSGYVLGDGAELENLSNMAEKHDLSNRIFFPGSVDNVESYLCVADIAVHPSNTEGMSNAILEQMSHALPVIAADIEPNKDVLTDGKDGVFFKNNDVESLKAKIKWLANDKTACRSIGEAARETVEQKFSMSVIADRYIETYKAMLEI